MTALLFSDKIKFCQERLTYLKTQRSLIKESLKAYEDPNGEGEYTNPDLLKEYWDINKKINAIFKEIQSLSGNVVNDIINEEETI